jgi:hypothetical protein
MRLAGSNAKAKAPRDRDRPSGYDAIAVKSERLA